MSKQPEETVIGSPVLEIRIRQSRPPSKRTSASATTLGHACCSEAAAEMRPVTTPIRVISWSAMPATTPPLPREVARGSEAVLGPRKPR
jgi:hypothetical protein